MNSKVSMVIRILLGLFVLVFGLNKFLDFLPAFEAPEAAGPYWQGLISTKTITLVGIVEILAGLALITNKWGALWALILMSVSVNAVLYHATLDSANIAPALVLLILNILAVYSYKDKYRDILKG